MSKSGDSEQKKTSTRAQIFKIRKRKKNIHKTISLFRTQVLYAKVFFLNLAITALFAFPKSHHCGVLEGEQKHRKTYIIKSSEQKTYGEGNGEHCTKT